LDPHVDLIGHGGSSGKLEGLESFVLQWKREGASSKGRKLWDKWRH
jgi:hypothetical protein